MTAYAVAGALAATGQDVSPGVLGFLVVAALGVATWLLIRSMNRQMRKIDLPDDTDDTDDTGDTGDTGADRPEGDDTPRRDGGAGRAPGDPR
jgi:hypothetical protein